MLRSYNIAFVALIVLIFAAGAAYADYGETTTTDEDYQITEPVPAEEGAGLGVFEGIQESVTGQETEPGLDICEIPPPSCGAYCEAGQVPPGWPYDWCSEYWLRPDSNF